METKEMCTFIGHRKIEVASELELRLERLIEDLIVNKNVDTFLFGSHSQFNHLCHIIVTRLREKYPFIKRVAYACKSDGSVLEKDIKAHNKMVLEMLKTNQHSFGVEKIIEHTERNFYCKASYVERNHAMIDDAKYCVFYYDEEYLPKPRKYSKADIFKYQPKSGTKLAYDYACKKGKEVINLVQNN